MKRIGLVILILVFGFRGFSQLQDIQQLQLDLEKLVQMKMMLSSMYDGYSTLVKGYSNISSQVKGSFGLHKNYLDGLLQVAGPVKNYPLIQTIAEKQVLIVSESQTAYLVYFKSGLFKAEELIAVKNKLDGIKSSAAKLMDHLQVVLTPGALRMSDQERIAAIDRIDKDVGEALATERALVKERNAVAAIRGQQKKDIDAMRVLYGLKN